MGVPEIQLTNPTEFEALFNFLGPNQTRKLKLQVYQSSRTAFNAHSNSTLVPVKAAHASRKVWHLTFRFLTGSQQVPDTVFLACNSRHVGVTSILSCKQGVVHRWTPKRVNMKVTIRHASIYDVALQICEAFHRERAPEEWARSARNTNGRNVWMQALWELARKWCDGVDHASDEPVAVARYVNASYLLNAQMLDQLVQSITRSITGILSTADEAPAQLDASCVELQVRPAAPAFRPSVDCLLPLHRKARIPLSWCSKMLQGRPMVLHITAILALLYAPPDSPGQNILKQLRCPPTAGAERRGIRRRNSFRSSGIHAASQRQEVPLSLCTLRELHCAAFTPRAMETPGT